MFDNKASASIKRIKKNRGISFELISDETGLSHTTISKFHDGVGVNENSLLIIKKWIECNKCFDVDVKNEDANIEFYRQKLLDIKEKIGVSYNELSRLSGVSASTLRQFVFGMPPKKQTLEAIMDFVNNKQSDKVGQLSIMKWG